MGNTDHNILYISMIWKGLSGSERTMASKYILLLEAARNNRSEKEARKGNLSYNFLLDIGSYNELKEKKDIISYISVKYTSNQRRNLGNRVLRKLHDFLVLEANIEKVMADRVHKVQQFLTRNIAVIEVLLARRLFDEFLFLSNKLLKMADKYELYFEGCIILRLQIMYLLNIVNSRTFNKLVSQYQRRREWADRIFEASMYVNSLKLMFNEKSENVKIVEHIEKVISEMQPLENVITADSWKIHYYFILIEYYQQKRLYLESENICLKLIQLYSQSTITTKLTLGSSYVQLCGNQLLREAYTEAIKTCHKALTYFKPGLLNSITTSEVLFLALYHSGKNEEAYALVEKIVQYEKLKQNQMYLARWEYYRSILYFNEKKYKEAYLNLQNCTTLFEDKEGWGIGLRLLNLIILIERNLLHSIDSEIENLKRQINKLKKEGVVKKRYQVISKIISSIPRLDFDYKLIRARYKKDFDTLFSDDPELGWNVRSPDLVRFEEWIIGK